MTAVYCSMWVRKTDAAGKEKKKGDGWLHMKLWKQSALGAIPISLSG